MKAKGGFTGFVEAIFKDMSEVGSRLGAKLEDGNILDTIKKLANNLGGMLISGFLNKMGRPQKVMYNALLSPAPIGFWHVTIGNPRHPIMSIGNMVITDCSIEHCGPLGIDDFPTGLKVTVSLDRGKPRDLRDIEKLYMHGTDRIYSSMGDKVFDMYKNAKLYKDTRTNPDSYKPVTKYATINIPADSKSKPTISMPDYDSINLSLMKYFGTTDTYAVYVPAAEQEYGAGRRKKPSTAQTTWPSMANTYVPFGWSRQKSSTVYSNLSSSIRCRRNPSSYRYFPHTALADGISLQERP